MKSHCLYGLLTLATTSAFAGLTFPQTEIALQAAVDDTQARVSYAFTNEGDQTVVIEKMESTCGCTTPALKDKEIEPGESGEITVVFDFGSRRGSQHKTVTVHTSDGTHRLQLRVEIPEAITISPRVLRWSLEGDRQPQAIRCTLLDATKQQFGDIRIQGEGFTLEVREPETGVRELVVTPTADITRRTAILIVPHQVIDAETFSEERAYLMLR